MGRRKLETAALRTAKVGLRFRPADLAEVEAAAARQRLHRTEYVRRAALDAAGGKGERRADRQAVVEEMALWRREVRRLGILLNQLVRLTYHQGFVPDELEPLLREVQTTVAKAATRQ